MPGNATDETGNMDRRAFDAALATSGSGVLPVMRSLLAVAARKAPRLNSSATRKSWLSLLERITGELREERRKLQAVSDVSPPEVIRVLSCIEAQLARPLRIAIVGEFNSGKSSLANLLLGIEGLPTAVISSTQIPTLLYHSGRPRVFVVDRHGRRSEVRNIASIPETSIARLEVGLPSPRLQRVEILDLPGLADPRFDRGVGDLMLEAAHVLLWCTASTQAWKESERIAWEILPAPLRRCALLVVTHSDLVNDAKDTHKLLRRLRMEAGAFRDILLVSTTNALALLQGKRDELGHAAWVATGADGLDVALDQLLESVATRRIKVALAVAHRIASRALSRL
jgi:energy-coupling factor transporter ATP-binding protein EcfA2